MDRLRAMAVLAAVEEHGSMAAAARALDMAPAGVTRLVADLEASLGVRLLQRTTRRLAFTDAGQAFVDRSRDILAQIDEAEAAVQDASGPPRGRLRVLCAPSIAVHVLMPQLPAFCAAHPHVQITLDTPGVIDTVDEGHDLTLIAAREPLAGSFVARRIAVSEMVLCAAPSYLDRRGRPRVPADLARHDAMLPTRATVTRDLTLTHRQRGERVRLPSPLPLLAATHMDVMAAGATAGLGIAGVASYLAAPLLADGRLERLLPAWHLVSLDLWACMPTRRHVPARTRALLEHLLQALGGGTRDPWLAAAPLRADARIGRPAAPRPAARKTRRGGDRDG